MTDAMNLGNPKPDPSIYTIGGTVQANEQGLYIPRRADGELLRLCQQSTFAYVLTPRQMGKSSLMIRTAEVLIDEGWQAVIIDLTQVGAQVSAEDWYRGLLTLVADQLMLTTNVADWWQQQDGLGVTQRLTRFFQQVVLPEVDSPIVIFVDEIDTTLSLDFTDDFFAAIRFFYVARATEPEFRRLSFVLIGVATPGDLIRDAKRTPFNVGQRVELTDFTLAEVMPLAAGLGLAGVAAEQTLGWVLDWTGGHPYLTQRLCQEMAQVGGSWTEAEVERLVGRTFLGAQSEQDNNLQFVRDMLTKRAPEPVAVLKTYRDVRRGKPAVVDEEQSLVKSHLKLSGVVKRVGKALQVRNRVYYRVFDRTWIREHLPESLWQRLKPAMPLIVILFLFSVSMTGLAWYALEQANIAKQQSVLAQMGSTRALLQGDQRLDALVAGVQAARQAEFMKSSLTEQIKFQTLSMLSEVVHQFGSDEFQEHNRLEGHHGAVNSVDFSPDGKTIISASSDGEIKLWNQQGKKLKTIKAHTEQIRSVSFSPSSNTFASAGLNGEFKLWNLQGENLKTIKGNHDAILDLSFSPDDTRIALANSDGTATLWNQQGQELKILIGHKDLVTQVSFSPNSKMIASASADKTVKLWNLQGEELKTLRGHSAEVWGVSFSPDGTTIASASADKTVKLWNLQGEELKTLRGHSGAVGRVSFSPDSRLIASGGMDNTVKLWNLQGAELATLKGHRGQIWSLSFNPDGSTIASASADSTVKLWNIRNAATVLTGHRDIVESVSFSPDGSIIASASDDGAVKLWNRQGRELTTLKGHRKKVTGVSFSPDGSIIASASDDGTVKLWNRQGRELITLKDHLSAVSGVAFSSDGKIIASASDDGTINFWNRRGEKLNTLKENRGAVWDVSFSPDNAVVALANSDGTVQVWNRQERKMNLFEGHQGKVYDLSFNPGGNIIASSSQDGTIRLWNRQGEVLKILEGHHSPVTSINFSPDGSTLASTGADSKIKFWNLRGEELASIQAHSNWAWSVSFSSDGKFLISSGDRTAKVWVIDFDSLLAWSCDWLHDYLNNNLTIAGTQRDLCKITTE